MQQLDQLVGRQVGDFSIEERIGRGGMSVVYRAHQHSVNRDVALKVIVLNPDEDEFRRRFAQEAKLVATLEHIHILPIYDYGIIEGDIAYLAMRLLRGGSLSQLLTEGPLTLDQTADIFTQIGRGLAYAHRRNVIHRDLKPSNIMLDDADNAYLTDFGLAKLVGENVDMTKSGNIVGTPAYMAPEQLRGDSVDHRSDIYSMGVVLYHMLTGQAPFESSDSNVSDLPASGKTAPAAQ
jgi:serine/threonine protein kinase